MRVFPCLWLVAQDQGMILIYDPRVTKELTEAHANVGILTHVLS